MDCFLVSSQPIQPSTHQCFRCLQIYPKEIHYSLNCPHKQKLPVCHSQIKYFLLTTKQQLGKTNTNTICHRNYNSSSDESSVTFNQLFQAVCCGDQETLEEMLYSENFSLDNIQIEKMSRLLSWAMYKRQFSVFNTLMDFHEKCGKILNLDSSMSYFSEENIHPLLVYAARMNFIQGINRLLTGGANVNVMDKDHRTALWTACSVKCVQMVELLLNYGANIDAADCEGITPFMVSVRAMEPNLEIIVLLIRNGCSFRGPLWCPSVLYYILQNTNKQIVNMALISGQLSPEQIFKIVKTFLLNLSFIYEGGYTHIQSSDTRRGNIVNMKEMREYIKSLGYTDSPVLPSLQSKCRNVIRQTVKENFVGKLELGLEQLGLPLSLQLFVQLRDV
ncbi:uncharacterized protein LOC115209373 [Argonauta hians]